MLALQRRGMEGKKMQKGILMMGGRCSNLPETYSCGCGFKCRLMKTLRDHQRECAFEQSRIRKNNMTENEIQERYERLKEMEHGNKLLS